MNIHAGAVALIVCYHDKAPETNKKLCSEPVLDFMFTGHAWSAFRAGALRLRPMDFKYLFSVAVSRRLILSPEVWEGLGCSTHLAWLKLAGRLNSIT